MSSIERNWTCDDTDRAYITCNEIDRDSWLIYPVISSFPLDIPVHFTGEFCGECGEFCGECGECREGREHAALSHFGKYGNEQIYLDYCGDGFIKEMHEVFEESE